MPGSEPGHRTAAMKLSLMLTALALVEVFFLMVMFSPMFHDSRQKVELEHQLSIRATDGEAKAKMRIIHAREAEVEFFVRALVLFCIVADGWGIIAVVRRMRA